MYGILLLVVVALVSLLITRVATVALTVTGMAREPARFQARSALTGVGFTTSEAEQVVGHPVRRRIVMTLMLVGNVGLATVVAGMLGTFASASADASLVRATLLVGALAGLYVATRSPVIDHRLSRLAEAALRRYTRLDVRDYERLLHLAGDYAVQELAIGRGHWLIGAKLGDARLRDEGILVLGINRRDGRYVGVPGRATDVREGDTLIVYGRGASVERLSGRSSGEQGDREHARAVSTQRRVARRERRTGTATGTAAGTEEESSGGRGR